MSKASSKSTGSRITNYGKQTSRTKLTPAQRKRASQKRRGLPEPIFGLGKTLKGPSSRRKKSR